MRCAETRDAHLKVSQSKRIGLVQEKLWSALGGEKSSAIGMGMDDEIEQSVAAFDNIGEEQDLANVVDS